MAAGLEVAVGGGVAVAVTVGVEVAVGEGVAVKGGGRRGDESGRGGGRGRGGGKGTGDDRDRDGRGRGGGGSRDGGRCTGGGRVEVAVAVGVAVGKLTAVRWPAAGIFSYLRDDRYGASAACEAWLTQPSQRTVWGITYLVAVWRAILRDHCKTSTVGYHLGSRSSETACVQYFMIMIS